MTLEDATELKEILLLEVVARRILWAQGPVAIDEKVALGSWQLRDGALQSFEGGALGLLYSTAQLMYYSSFNKARKGVLAIRVHSEQLASENEVDATLFTNAPQLPLFELHPLREFRRGQE
mmetsp:Transcript_31955/g.79555  ORF Transcript_31955/g.79555 Transcript_31955/m.79555 type:complete len:121 (-) Transcript_31955:616-978(-)